MSESVAENIGVCLSNPINAPWLVRVTYPFAYSVSKNATYSNGQGLGHVFLREKSRAYRDGLTIMLQQALKGRKIYQNKIWLEIFVQKPNHKGDAVNVVDTVCDAVKDAIGVDDRWFSIKRLDWQITKSDPHLIIGISQEDCFDAQSCNTCGRILAFDQFYKQKGNKAGISRQCRSCLTGNVEGAEAEIVPSPLLARSAA